MNARPKVALVTGGSRGIGRTVSLELAARGYFVAINYLSNQKKAESTLADVRDKGAEGSIHQVEVTNPEQV